MNEANKWKSHANGRNRLSRLCIHVICMVRVVESGREEVTEAGTCCYITLATLRLSNAIIKWTCWSEFGVLLIHYCMSACSNSMFVAGCQGRFNKFPHYKISLNVTFCFFKCHSSSTISLSSLHPKTDNKRIPSPSLHMLHSTRERNEEHSHAYTCKIETIDSVWWWKAQHQKKC